MVTKAASKPVWDFRRGVATARVLVQLGLDRGLNLDTLLRHTGIAPALLDAPQGEIDAQQEIQLIRNLQAELPQVETLGLEAGTRYHVTTYGLWGYAVLSSPPLGSAFGMAARMLNQTFSLGTNEVEQLGDQVMISYQVEHLPPDIRQFVLDRDRAAAVTLQREILGQPMPYRAMLLRRPEPSPQMVEAYTQLFGVRPLFGQPQDRSLFDASLMHQPLPQANAHTKRLCEDMLKKLIDARSQRTGVAATVRDRLLRNPGQIPDMEEVAAEMRMTSRTLRRHLTAEGATFPGLLEEVRSTLTEELMGGANLTHGEIAERLGYADVTTFIEAFRRWKGVPPSEYRRASGLTNHHPRLSRRRFIPR